MIVLMSKAVLQNSAGMYAQG